MKIISQKLRFSEFRSDWSKKSLGDITTWSSGGTPRKDNSEYWDGTIPWISASSMRGLVYSTSEKKITEQGLKNGSRLAKKGSLLLLVRGSMLFNKIPIGITGVDVAFNQDLKSIIVNKSSTSQYLLYWFISKEPTLLDMVTGTGIGAGKLDLNDLKKIKINLPSLEEQTKIANFLTAIDEKINLLKEKAAALAEYKKGMMQKIFNQELRFKDEFGKDFEDCQEKSLGEIGQTFNGLTGKSKENFGIGGKPYIQYKQIFDNSKVNIQRCELVEITQQDKQNKVQFGDVFFTISSETQNEIGTASVLLETVEEMYLNSFCFGYRANSLKVLVPEFSRYIFRSSKFRADIVKLAQGSTRYNMSKVSLMKLTILLPCEKEQTKIAAFLSAIDEKIDLVKTQIEDTQEYKKGLLQQMFV